MAVVPGTACRPRTGALRLRPGMPPERPRTESGWRRNRTKRELCQSANRSGSVLMSVIDLDQIVRFGFRPARSHRVVGTVLIRGIMHFDIP